MDLPISRTLSVTVERSPAEVLAVVRDPRALPRWAPGFALAVRESEQGWVVETAAGDVRVEFAPDNELGVADHRVWDDQGLDVLNPVRVLALGDGAEVLFTLRQEAGTSDEEQARDVALVEADLQTLKALLESGG